MCYISERERDCSCSLATGLLMVAPPAAGTDLDPLPRWATPRSRLMFWGKIGELMFLELPYVQQYHGSPIV